MRPEVIGSVLPCLSRLHLRCCLGCFAASFSLVHCEFPDTTAFNPFLSPPGLQTPTAVLRGDRALLVTCKMQIKVGVYIVPIALKYTPSITGWTVLEEDHTVATLV